MNTRKILPLLSLLFLTLAAPALATVTVTVSSPASTASVPTSFNVVAAASTSASGASITGWWLYIDDNQAWYGNPTTSINAPLTLPIGSHQVVVRAWDSTGAFGSQTLNLTASVCSGICVTVTSPSETGTVPSPVRFTANATDGAGRTITGYVIYANNTNIYRGDTLDRWVILAPGTYNVFIRAWDSSGAFGSSATFPITVQGTTIPTPLAGAVVFDDLDDASGWESCGTMDCAGGGANADSWPMAQNVASPSYDGASAQIQIFGDPGPMPSGGRKWGPTTTRPTSSGSGGSISPPRPLRPRRSSSTPSSSPP